MIIYIWIKKYACKRQAAKQLITLPDQTIIGILKETAQALRTHTEEVLAANRQDLEHMDPANPKYDRLKLTEERLQGIRRYGECINITFSIK